MPKTYNNLFDSICDFGNIHDAYLKARKCKRYNKDVLQFSSNLEEELLRLQNELCSGSYRTGRYRKFFVFEPKKRKISALPFRDRVVHHAICNVIEPLFEKKFITDSYACRKGKGSHAGSDKLTELLKTSKRKWDVVYCLKADISKYFYSVDHSVLKGILRKTIRCRKTLGLLDEIIESVDEEKGLPIGNLTSQLAANIYLNDLDHYVKEKLKVKYYIRYLDDFILLHNDKKQLQAWKDAIETYLNNTLRLQLNVKTSIFPVTQGVDFLGYRTWPTHKLLRKRSIFGMRKKLKYLAELYSKNKKTIEDVKRVLASWLGHAQHANARNVIKRVLRGIVFVRE